MFVFSFRLERQYGGQSGCVALGERGTTLGSVQVYLMVLHSGITPGNAQEAILGPLHTNQGPYLSVVGS